MIFFIKLNNNTVLKLFFLLILITTVLITSCELGQIPCEKIDQEWINFVSQNSSCIADEECIVTGGKASCSGWEYGFSIYGSAITVRSYEKSKPILQRVISCEKKTGDLLKGEADQFSQDAKCNKQGRCQVVIQSCAGDPPPKIP